MYSKAAFTFSHGTLFTRNCIFVYMYYGKAAVSSWPGSAAVPAAACVGTQGSSIVYLHDDELMQVAGSTAANRARPYYSYSSLTLPLQSV